MMPETVDDPDAHAAGARLFAAPCAFLTGVVDIAGLPPEGLPEVAFAGRSNVGKSSLLNALVRRKALARTSNTPGRTREINFYLLGDAAHLVDLPGYGYAKAPKTQVKGWNRLIDDYLRGRPGLSRVFLLIDARHGLKGTDAPTLDLLDEAAVSYQGVLTKADKLKAGALEAVTERTATQLARRPAAFPGVIATSSQTGAGLDDLRDAIAGLTLG